MSIAVLLPTVLINGKSIGELVYYCISEYRIYIVQSMGLLKRILLQFKCFLLYLKRGLCAPPPRFHAIFSRSTSVMSFASFVVCWKKSNGACFRHHGSRSSQDCQFACSCCHALVFSFWNNYSKCFLSQSNKEHAASRRAYPHSVRLSTCRSVLNHCGMQNCYISSFSGKIVYSCKLLNLCDFAIQNSLLANQGIHKLIWLLTGWSCA